MTCVWRSKLQSKDAKDRDLMEGTEKMDLL